MVCFHLQKFIHSNVKLMRFHDPFVGLCSVSGMTTKIAMFAVVQNTNSKNVMGPLWQNVFLILSFLLGSTVTGCLIRAATFKLGKFFGVLMIIESLLLFLSTVLYAGDAFVGAQYAAGTLVT